MEHNLNTSGFAKIRVFQKLDENRLPYSIFLGTLTENGKIYLEQRFEKKENRWIQRGFFIIAIISAIISAVSFLASQENSKKNVALENRVYQLEQGAIRLNSRLDSLDDRMRYLSDSLYSKYRFGRLRHTDKELLTLKKK